MISPFVRQQLRRLPVPYRPLFLTFCASVPLLLALPLTSRGDIVGLSNGGHLRGEVEQSKSRKAQQDELNVRTLTGGRITVQRSDVQSITQRRLVVEEYEIRAGNTPDTVDAQWELAQWCRDNHLNAQRKSHLLNIVRLDPEHEVARRLLGHVRRQGEWVSRDDAMLKNGYVKHDGVFVTLQERELLEQRDAQRDEEVEWHRKIRGWYLSANGRNAQRRGEGLDNLSSVKHPNAIPGLTHFLQNNRNVNWRSLYVKILAQIPGDRPVGPLAAMSLHDEDANVRTAAYEAMGAERQTVALAQYVSELQNGLNVVVGRAAVALGKIGDTHVVPQLIDALVTTHTYRVRVPTNEGTYSFNRNGSMSSGDLILPPAIEAGLLTGQYPNGVIVLQPDRPVRTKLVVVKRDHQNADVLAALTKLTGESSFGYDENAWRIWWNSQKNQPAG
jgi:hypothetical protein